MKITSEQRKERFLEHLREVAETDHGAARCVELIEQGRARIDIDEETDHILIVPTVPTLH